MSSLVASRKQWSEVCGLRGWDDAIPALARAIDAECRCGDSLPRAQVRTVFDGSEAAPVSVQDYIIRLVKYGFCTPQVFTLAGLYIRRLREQAGVRLTSHNIHRVLIAAFVVAAKLRDDSYYSNAYYARVGGVGLSELNRLEESFLKCIGWQLWADVDEFNAFRTGLLHWDQQSRARETAHTAGGGARAGGGGGAAAPPAPQQQQQHHHEPHPPPQPQPPQQQQQQLRQQQRQAQHPAAGAAEKLRANAQARGGKDPHPQPGLVMSSLQKGDLSASTESMCMSGEAESNSQITTPASGTCPTSPASAASTSPVSASPAGRRDRRRAAHHIGTVGKAALAHHLASQTFVAAASR